MSDLSDWAAAAYIAVKNANNMSNDAAVMMEQNTDFPATKAKVVAIGTVLSTIAAPPAEA
jgi:hypothetical protein